MSVHLSQRRIEPPAEIWTEIFTHLTLPIDQKMFGMVNCLFHQIASPFLLTTAGFTEILKRKHQTYLRAIKETNQIKKFSEEDQSFGILAKIQTVSCKICPQAKSQATLKNMLGETEKVTIKKTDYVGAFFFDWTRLDPSLILPNKTFTYLSELTVLFRRRLFLKGDIKIKQIYQIVFLQTRNVYQRFYFWKQKCAKTEILQVTAAGLERHLSFQLRSRIEAIKNYNIMQLTAYLPVLRDQHEIYCTTNRFGVILKMEKLDPQQRVKIIATSLGFALKLSSFGLNPPKPYLQWECRCLPQSNLAVYPKLIELFQRVVYSQTIEDIEKKLLSHLKKITKL